MTQRIGRGHIKHFERTNGTAHATWRLRPEQSSLTELEREGVLAVLRRAAEFGCVIRSAVVMDDHVHVLFDPGRQRSSEEFVSAWKSVSAHEMVKAGARTAPIWQAEYYLRWMNSPEETATCATYIRLNPSRRWPGTTAYPWLLP